MTHTVGILIAGLLGGLGISPPDALESLRPIGLWLASIISCIWNTTQYNLRNFGNVEKYLSQEYFNCYVTEKGNSIKINLKQVFKYIVAIWIYYL